MVVEPTAEGIGLASKLFGAVRGWWRNRYPLSPLVAMVHEEWRKGYAIRQNAHLAAETPQALTSLRQEAQAWAGAFHLRIAEEAPALYDRYKDESKAVPTTLGELRRAISQDLKLLRRLERELRHRRLVRLRWHLLWWRRQ